MDKAKKQLKLAVVGLTALSSVDVNAQAADVDYDDIIFYQKELVLKYLEDKNIVSNQDINVLRLNEKIILNAIEKDSELSNIDPSNYEYILSNLEKDKYYKLLKGAYEAQGMDFVRN